MKSLKTLEEENTHLLIKHPNKIKYDIRCCICNKVSAMKYRYQNSSIFGKRCIECFLRRQKPKKPLEL